jgi:hypothetical protein
MKNRFYAFLFLVPLLGFVSTAQAQQSFEAGALAVASAYKGNDVRAGSVLGSIGFQPGAAGGLFFGQNMNDHLGGELRYVFSHNDLKLKSGNTETSFGAHTHVFHYDLLVYAQPRNARIRLYAAGGGGLKVYQGVGAEQAFQPLSNLALLSRTRQTMGVVDFGGGVKVHLSRNMMFRAEVRDYVTEVPKVFAAAPGASISGMVHQWMPAFGISWVF